MPVTDLASNDAALKRTRTAVLPAMNEPADLDAPTVFRFLPAAELADKGTALIEPSRIDEALGQRGVQKSGQIEALTPQEIGVLVGAFGLFHMQAMGVGGHRNRLIADAEIFSALNPFGSQEKS